MRLDDITFAVQDVLRRKPRQIATTALAVVLGTIAIVVISRAFLGPGVEQPDVEGMQRADRQRVEAAREERDRQAEALRRESEAAGEDPDADAKRPADG